MTHPLTKILRTFGVPVVGAFLLSTGVHAGATEVGYGKNIQPIFNTYCVQCHQPDGPGFAASGLDLRTYEGAMKGTRHGPVIVPGDAFTSNLMAVIEGRTDASIGMPHNTHRAMTKKDRRILRTWVVNGATKADYGGKPSRVIGELCLRCHTLGGQGYAASGLDMRTYESLMKGTQYGPVVVPGDPVISNLIVLIEGRAGGGLKMPYDPQAKPFRQEKVLLRRWINQGAKKN